MEGKKIDKKLDTMKQKQLDTMKKTRSRETFFCI